MRLEDHGMAGTSSKEVVMRNATPTFLQLFSVLGAMAVVACADQGPVAPPGGLFLARNANASTTEDSGHRQ